MFNNKILITQSVCVLSLFVIFLVSCGGGSSDSTPIDNADQQFTIDAKTNIYLSDLTVIPELEDGAGEIPPSYSLTSTSGQILTIVSASGAISCCTDQAATAAPDGRASPGGARIDPFMGFSGITYLRRAMFLTAVFTNDRDVDATPPDTLDYSTTDPNTVVEYFPEMNQVFFVGDGKTTDGTTQSFYVPEGATRIHFGTVDGSSFVGISSHFDDNHGSFQISIRVE